MKLHTPNCLIYLIRMKRTILVILLFLSGIGVMKSQRFNGGISAGFIASQVDGDRLSGYNKIGITGGGFVNTWYNKQWGGQFEIRYAGKGAVDPQISNIYQVMFIELPVMGLYRYSSKIQAELGLYPAYLIQAQSKEQGANPVEDNKDYHDFDIGGLAGIRYMFSEKMWVNLRFSYSLIPYYKSEEAFRCTPRFASGCYFNNVLQFSINYQFNDS